MAVGSPQEAQDLEEEGQSSGDSCTASEDGAYYMLPIGVHQTTDEQTNANGGERGDGHPHAPQGVIVNGRLEVERRIEQRIDDPVHEDSSKGEGCLVPD
jgi:hypothetical protein